MEPFGRNTGEIMLAGYSRTRRSPVRKRCTRSLKGSARASTSTKPSRLDRASQPTSAPVLAAAAIRRNLRRPGIVSVIATLHGPRVTHTEAPADHRAQFVDRAGVDH